MGKKEAEILFSDWVQVSLISLLSTLFQLALLVSLPMVCGFCGMLFSSPSPTDLSPQSVTASPSLGLVTWLDPCLARPKDHALL